jgi:MtN3 and saliva related transmembrane protein
MRAGVDCPLAARSERLSAIGATGFIVSTDHSSADIVAAGQPVKPSIVAALAKRLAHHGRVKIMEASSVIGAAATLCSTTSFLPQAWKVIRTRDTSAISSPMYVITVAGFSLWLVYGAMLGQWPLIVTNGVCLLLSAFILLMKLLTGPQREAVAAKLDPAA